MSAASPSGGVYLDQYLAPLDPWLKMDAVSEIAVNRPGEVWVERAGVSGMERHEVAALTSGHLASLARQIAAHSHQAINAETPLLSAALPTGERVQVVLPPAAPGAGADQGRAGSAGRPIGRVHPQLRGGAQTSIPSATPRARPRPRDNRGGAGAALAAARYAQHALRARAPGAARAARLEPAAARRDGRTSPPPDRGLRNDEYLSPGRSISPDSSRALRRPSISPAP